jgi:hypothetical protein
VIYAIPGHIPKIIQLLKDQTRRQAHTGDYLSADGLTVYNAKGHIRFQVGQVKCVQPGRGKAGVWVDKARIGTNLPATFDDYIVDCREQGIDVLQRPDFFIPLRIRITAIAREDVRQISAADALSEGGYTTRKYIQLWSSLYDKTLGANVFWNDELYPTIYSRLAALYDCWALSFSVVQP